MSNKSNVINFKERAEKRKKAENGSEEHEETAKGSWGDHAVVDMTARRQEAMETERRSVARTVLSQFIGVFVVLPTKGLQSVNLHDVSENGLAFDLPQEAGQYNIGDSVTMRIYLSHDTYFSFGVKVSNRRTTQAQGVSRHGAVFAKNDQSFKTLFYFTKFLESVSTIAKKDNGDRLMGRVD
jgi:hypothetical protein